MMNAASTEIAIICRKLNKKEEEYLTPLEFPIYTFSKDYISANSALHSKSKLLSSTSNDYSELHLQRVVSFGHAKATVGKSIAEILRNDGSSYWYYLRFSLFQRSRSAFIEADKINEFLTKENIQANIHLYSNQSESSNLIKNELFLYPGENKAKSGISITYLIKYLFLFALRSIYGSLRNKMKSTAARKMVIANPYLVQKVLDPQSGAVKKGDPHLQNLIDRTVDHADYNYLTQLRPPSLEANHKLSIPDYISRKEYGKKSIYFEPFLLAALFKKKRKKRVKELEAKFQEMRALQKNQISAEEQLLINHLLNLKKTLKLAIWREEAAKQLFSTTSTTKLIAIDEHSLQNRSIFSAAKENKIKTIAIQHGAISKGNIAYRFVQEDGAFNPWPDLSLLRGTFNYKAMQMNYYPSHSLEVVGHMRTDVIPNLLKKSRKANKIVYATQPMPPADTALKKKQLNDFLSLCKSLKDEQFAIKAHPNEGVIELYKELAESGNYPNLQLYEGELYHLLAESKLLITYYSTVGLEAIYFNKEVITLDYEERDFQGYSKAGIAHTVHNGSELIHTVENILQGDLRIADEKKLQFIEERAFKIDGHVTERILEKVEN